MINMEGKHSMEKPICIDRIYLNNKGYWDRACCVLYKNKKYYYYFKEIGNNQGYCMGQEVYGIYEDSYNKCKNGSFNRNRASNFILELSAGDCDWLENERLLNILVQNDIDNEKSKNVLSQNGGYII